VYENFSRRFESDRTTDFEFVDTDVPKYLAGNLDVQPRAQRAARGDAPRFNPEDASADA
jgi:hypothetical protein